MPAALKSGPSAEIFQLTRKWTPPRVVLGLAAGPLALVNEMFFVTDYDLAAEVLLIGLPIIQHPGLDSKTC